MDPPRAEPEEEGDGEERRPTSLQDLPAELLYSIHHLSLSSTLPQVSSHLHLLLSHSSPYHKASFLALRHPKRTLAHAIKYPICTLPVLLALERLSTTSTGKKRKPLRCTELPKRLVRAVDAELDLALLTHMLEAYGSSPNSHKGYFLARAVLANHLPLIRLLLAHGGDPALKDGWAVNAAIGRGDLPLVRLLMEREVVRDAIGEEEGEDEVKGAKGKKRRRTSGGGGGKRRKMEDLRCEPTSGMLEAAVRGQQWAIVDYLTARGAKPNLEVLKLL
ncbi:hypothetical protein RQP46_005346 [Phenoliferia psychrophenolica]